MVVGNTELGVEVKFKHCDYPVYICPNGVKEMSEIKVTQAGVRFDKVIFQINSNIRQVWRKYDLVRSGGRVRPSGGEDAQV